MLSLVLHSPRRSCAAQRLPHYPAVYAQHVRYTQYLRHAQHLCHALDRARSKVELASDLLE